MGSSRHNLIALQVFPLFFFIQLILSVSGGAATVARSVYLLLSFTFLVLCIFVKHFVTFCLEKCYVNYKFSLLTYQMNPDSLMQTVLFESLYYVTQTYELRNERFYLIFLF